MGDHQVPDGPSDRAQANTLAINEAYLTLCQSKRQHNASALTILLQHLQPTCGQASAGGGSDITAAALTAQEAVLSLLLGLAFSSPKEHKALVGLPGLESSQLEECMRQARVVLATAPTLSRDTPACEVVDAGEPPASTSTFGPVAGAAISLLQQRPLIVPGVAAPAAAAAAGAAGTPDSGLAWCNPGLTSLMLQAGAPPQQQWGAVLGAGENVQDAEAAAAAAGRRVRALALRRMAGREPLCELPALPGQLTLRPGTASLAQSAVHAAAGSKLAPWAGQQQEAKQQRASPGTGRIVPNTISSGEATRPAEAWADVAAEGAAEEGEEADLVCTACLALQGVCSAIAELKEVAAGDRKAGLCRPAARRRLLAQLLQLAEARVRLEAFVAHHEAAFAAASTAAAEPPPPPPGPVAAGPTDGSAGPAAAGGGGPAGKGSPESDAILQAFVAAVRQVLRMQASAMQVLHRRHGGGGRGSHVSSCSGGAEDTCAELDGGGRRPKQQGMQKQEGKQRGPQLTLAGLVISLGDAAAQLRDLSRLCRCRHAMASSAPPGPVPGLRGGRPATSLLGTPSKGGAGGERTAAAATAAAAAAVAAPVARAELVPWPAELAPWVEAWGWGPSVWQQNGFVNGLQLLDGLYNELMQAPKSSAPLPRFLFNASVQPLLRYIRDWAFHPSHAAAAASAAAAAAAGAGAGPGGAPSPASSLALPTRTGAAADGLAAFWEARADGPPDCPAFLSGAAQRDLREARRHLRLLQLLGGAPAALARRLGVIAGAEDEELRLIFSNAASGLGGRGQPAGGPRLCGGGGGGGSGGGSNHLFLLMRRGGGDEAGGGGRLGAGRRLDVLDVGMGMDTLQKAWEAFEDYTKLRAEEATHLLQLLDKERTAAAAARRAAVMARWHERAAQQEAAREERLREATERRLERAGTLQRQKRAAEQQGARRRAERQAEIAEERALLAAQLLKERQQAERELREELALCGMGGEGNIGGMQPAGSGGPTLADSGGNGGGAAEAAATGVQGALGTGAGAEAEASDRQQHVCDGDRVSVAAADASASEAVQLPAALEDIELEDRETLTSPVPEVDAAADGRAAAEQPSAGAPAGGAAAAAALAPAQRTPADAAGPVSGAADARQQAQEQRAAGVSGPRRHSTWGMPLHPFPEAGAASRPQVAAADSLGGGGAATAAAAASAQRLAAPGAGTRRGRAATAAAAAAQPKPPPASKWGVPRNPFQAAGGPSAHLDSFGRRSPPRAQRGQLVSKAVRIVNASPLKRRDKLAAAAAAGTSNPDASDAAAATDAGRRPAQSHLPGDQQRDRGAGAPGVDPVPSLAATAAREPAPLPLALEVCVAAPLAAQARLVTAACWRLIVFHWDLPGAVRSLAHIYFQGAGDLGDFLAASAEAMLAAGRPPPAAAAQAALEAAVAASSCAGHPYAQSMCLEVRPDRRVLRAETDGLAAGSGAAASAAARRLRLGDSLLLTHRPAWPLCLVIRRSHLEQYADVFSVLLRARRTSLLLDAMWRRLCSRAAGGGGGGERLRRLRAWAGLAAHCVRGVRAFAHEQLLGGTCEALAVRLEERPASVDDMRAAHDEMLRMARRYCLLPPADGDWGGGGGLLISKQQEPQAAAAASGGGARAGEAPVLSALAAEVHGMMGCCWRLHALAAAVLDDDEQQQQEQHEPQLSLCGSGWDELERSAADLAGRVQRAKGQLRSAALLEPCWEGLLARLE